MGEQLTAKEKDFLMKTLDGMIEGISETPVTLKEAAVYRELIEIARGIQLKLPRMDTASD